LLGPQYSEDPYPMRFADAFTTENVGPDLVARHVSPNCSHTVSSSVEQFSNQRIGDAIPGVVRADMLRPGIRRLAAP
jgi:hypothetical protein